MLCLCVFSSFCTCSHFQSLLPFNAQTPHPVPGAPTAGKGNTSRQLLLFFCIKPLPKPFVKTNWLNQFLLSSIYCHHPQLSLFSSHLSSSFSLHFLVSASLQLFLGSSSASVCSLFSRKLHWIARKKSYRLFQRWAPFFSPTEQRQLSECELWDEHVVKHYFFSNWKIN